MKRLIPMLLALCLALCLCACGTVVEPPAEAPAAEALPEAGTDEAAPAAETEAPEEPGPEADAPAEADIEPVIQAAPDYASWWGGKWYGWAVYTQAQGRFSDLQDESWDVVAQIDVQGSEGSIRIYDITDQTEAELSADVRFAQGLTEHGQMICRYGSFIDIAYGSNTWVCDPGSGPEGRLEHTISFSFTYAEAEYSADSVVVYYFLRPWGMLWDDVREADTSDMLYEDMMPQRYEDWYLPQLG